MVFYENSVQYYVNIKISRNLNLDMEHNNNHFRIIKFNL